MHRAAVPARARRGLLRPLPAMDLPFLILVLTLVGFGLVMLYSASSAVALYRRGRSCCMRPWASGPCGRPAGWITTSITN